MGGCRKCFECAKRLKRLARVRWDRKANEIYRIRQRLVVARGEMHALKFRAHRPITWLGPIKALWFGERAHHAFLPFAASPRRQFARLDARPVFMMIPFQKGVHFLPTVAPGTLRSERPPSSTPHGQRRPHTFHNDRKLPIACYANSCAQSR